MFDRERPYSFHIELTDKCNAGCPMCGRTDPNGCRPNAKVGKIELSLADIRAQFTPDFCGRVEEVQLGGGLGDALAASECLEICDYLTSQGIRLIVSTNGSLRSVAWWRDFGRVMARNGSHLELHVDGLADTNPLYRVNTDFAKIMNNARAYLDEGAVADWYYILFRHNEHQVEAARDLALAMGFRDFVLIDTIRFGSAERFDYVLPDGTPAALEPATRRAHDFSAELRTASGDAAAQAAKPPPAAPAGSASARAAAGIAGVRCKAQVFNRPYITADGQVSACCWIEHSDEEAALQRAAGRDAEAFNIRSRPLEAILHDEPFASLYEASWHDGSTAICTRKCGGGPKTTRARL